MFFQISQDPLVSANSISSCTLETSLNLTALSLDNRLYHPGVMEGLQEKGKTTDRMTQWGSISVGLTKIVSPLYIS